MALKWFTSKDPNAVKNYAIDWSLVLASGETIATSVWVAEAGITVGADSTLGGVTTVLLSGGVADTDYAVTNTITTSLGQTDERTVTLRVKER